MRMKRYIKKVNIASLLSTISLGIFSFSYFFQFPFSKLAGLLVPSMLLFLVINFRYILKNTNPRLAAVYVVYIVYLIANVCFAIIVGNEISSIIRFSLILCVLPLCANCRKNTLRYERFVFLMCAILKSLVIIGIMMYLFYTRDHSLLRFWAFQHSYGDIYISVTGVPKVQVQGNALLVMAFILSYDKERKWNLKNIILLLGVIGAGNFAYYLGLVAYFGVIISKKIVESGISEYFRVIVFVILLILSFVFCIFAYNQSKIKSEVSNATRIDQAKVLLDGNWLTGEGLGNKIIAKTNTRNYDGDIYFELQTLYIINQIGSVGLLLLQIQIYITLGKIKKRNVFLYTIYLIYTFWNPYCYDTTHMLSIIMLANMGDSRKTGIKKEKNRK